MGRHFKLSPPLHSSQIQIQINLQTLLKKMMEQILCIIAILFAPSASGSEVYIGCYRDGNERAMIKVAEGQKGTQKRCLFECLRGDYDYFALQFPPKQQCFCSNDLYKSTSYGEADNCEDHGAGPAGGAMANSIYKIYNCDTAYSQYRSLGCYGDTAERAMELKVGGQGYLPEDCYNQCKGRSFSYFGLQDGESSYVQQCWCSNSFFDSSQNGHSPKCRGNVGGSMAINLYQIARQTEDGLKFCMV